MGRAGRAAAAAGPPGRAVVLGLLGILVGAARAAGGG